MKRLLAIFALLLCAWTTIAAPIPAIAAQANSQIVQERLLEAYPALGKISDPQNVRSLDEDAALELQRLLNNGGYYQGDLDGIPGPQTAEALAEFKELNHLEIPDLVGPTTITKIVELHSEPPITRSSNCGLKIDLPTGESVCGNDPVIPGGHFYWREVVKNDLRRTPDSTSVVANVRALARELENVRALLDNVPIVITSWNRPLAINLAIGSGPGSSHIQGYAADVFPVGVNLYEAQRRLDEYWGDRGGVGFGALKGFVHLDLRGWGARWFY